MVRTRRTIDHSTILCTVPALLSALGLGVLLAASPVSAQTAKDEPVPAPRDTRPAPCRDCPADGAAKPAGSESLTLTPDMKTVVPQPVMREQADFRLNSVLRRVPGVGINR